MRRAGLGLAWSPHRHLCPEGCHPRSSPTAARTRTPSAPLRDCYSTGYVVVVALNAATLFPFAWGRGKKSSKCG